MKSGRLSQLQCWDMSGHEAHYPNFLCHGLTPGHSCQGQSIKSSFTNPHFTSKLLWQGKNISLSNLALHVLWHGVVKLLHLRQYRGELCTVVMSSQSPSEQKEIHLAVNKPDADKIFTGYWLWALSVASSASFPRNKMKKIVISLNCCSGFPMLWAQ